MRPLILSLGIVVLATVGNSADPDPKKEPTAKPQQVKIHARHERYNGPGEVAPSTSPSHTGSIVIRNIKQLYYYKADPPEKRVVAVAKALNVPAIDFDKQMLILLMMADRAAGSSMTIESTEIKDSRLVVRWKIVPPKIHRLNQKENLAGMFLVDRFDGEVVFDPPLPVPLREEEIHRIIRDNPEADLDSDAIVQPLVPPVVEEYPPGGSDIRVFAHLASDERIWGQFEKSGTVVAVRRFDDYKNLPWYHTASSGFEDRLAKSFQVRKIDLSKQMILHVYGGYRPQGLNFTQVESIRKVNGKLVVRVRIGTIKDPHPTQYFLGQVLLTERFDGEIVFERVEGEWLKGKMVAPINTDEFGGSDLKVFNVRRSSGHSTEGARPRVEVARSVDEIWKIFGDDRRDDKLYHAEQVFGYRKVDMKTQMILRVTSGYLPREGFRLKVTSLKIVDGTLVIRSELTEDSLNDSSTYRSHNPGEILLVEKFNGPIRMAPIDDQTTLKSRLAGSSRIALLAQGMIDLPASTRVGKRNDSGYEKRIMHWSVQHPAKAGEMLNMPSEKVLEMARQALKVESIDFDRQMLLFLADGITDGERTYTFHGGRRIGANVFAEVEERAFVPYRNELFVYFRIKDKPHDNGKKAEHLPIAVLLTERYGGYFRFEKNPLSFVDR